MQNLLKFGLLGIPSLMFGQNQQPNILLVISDDLRNELEVYGANHMKTPNFNVLSQDGITFTRAYVQQAVSSASRASFLTGCRPDVTGVDYPYSKYFVDTFLPQRGAIQNYLYANGYYTRTFGKIHHGLTETLSEEHFNPSKFLVDVSYALPENQNKPKITLPPFECADVPDEAYRDGLVSREVVETLKRIENIDAPFFMLVGFHKPHLPFSAPKKYWDLYDRDNLPLSPNPQATIDAPSYAPANHASASFSGENDADDTEILDFKPSNPNATVETKHLYDLLLGKREQGILFGHHMTISQGKNFRAIPIDESNIQSDVYTAVNDFPAISSFDFARGFEDKLLSAVKKFNSMGGIITFSYHMKNPVTDGGYNDTSGNPVTKILTDPTVQNKYKSELDNVAAFCDNAKIDGKHIPIIFRPFHEHTGDWFWWGMSHCSEQEYIDLWRFTYNYLVNIKGLNNLLFAFSPSKPSKYAKYDIRYPGNDFVDICGFDYYEQGDFSCELIKSAELCYNFANKNGKIAAITEFGVRKGLQNTDIADWYMSAFLELIKSNFFGQKMTYAVTWMNSDNNSYWIPTNGDLTYDGFVSFYNDPYSIFLSDISDSTNTKIENEVKTLNDFLIYPNPVSDNLIIEHTGTLNSKLNLYNAFGQLVSTHYTISEQSSISFRDAEKGMYFIEISDEKNGIRQYFKIIKK